MEIGLEVIAGMTAGFGTVFTVMQWKMKQIKNQARFEILSEKDIISNQKDITQIKESIISIEETLEDLINRVARQEGAFNQHNKERRQPIS